MHIITVLILITTDKEMKKKNTGIEVQLERDFGGRIGLSFSPSERCIHEDCTEGVVVKRMIRLCYCS